MYLYTPQSNPTITCQLSKIRTDRTCRSTWPDAPVKRNGRKTERHRWVTGRTDQGWPDMSGRARTLLYFDMTLVRVQSVMTGHVRSAKYLTGTWDTCQHDQRVRFSQEPCPVNQVEMQWLLVLTRRVRSRQIPRPVRGKRLKRLWNAMQLEPSCFQLNFELYLSYLVLSLTSVHHT
jgi:hypothetical protein